MTILSMLPKAATIRVTRAMDAIVEFQLTDASGVAINITTDVFKFIARDPESHGITIALKTINPPHSDPTNGKFQLTLSKTDLADTNNEQEVTRWDYEVRRFVGGAAGNQIPWFAGPLELYPSVKAV